MVNTLMWELFALPPPYTRLLAFKVANETKGCAVSIPSNGGAQKFLATSNRKGTKWVETNIGQLCEGNKGDAAPWLCS
jgi:hypothetical protein